MRNIHGSAWTEAVPRPTAASFVALFLFLALVRAILITVLPLAVHDAFGNAQRVSLVYFAVSLFALVGGLTVPLVLRYARRRTVFTAAAILAIVSPLMMAQGWPLALVVGIALQVFAVGTLEIVLNLFIMDHIPRRDLNRFEPTRVFFAAGIWAIGPWLGVWLRSNVGEIAPYAIATAGAAILLGCFWFLRLTDNPAVTARKRPSPNPLVYFPRYFAQPRLLLAWLLAVGRSAWWSMFFIYAPIYAVTAGLGDVTAGAIVSLSTATFFLVPLWGRLARHRGVRFLLVAGYSATGLATLLAAAAMGHAGLGTAVLLLAATAAGLIDAAGNLPFLRAVHPHERAEMTTVYNTYRGVSQLVPPGIFALLLKLFELPAVFVATGLGMLVLTRYSLYLPKKL